MSERSEQHGSPTPPARDRVAASSRPVAPPRRTVLRGAAAFAGAGVVAAAVAACGGDAEDPTAGSTSTPATTPEPDGTTAPPSSPAEAPSEPASESLVTVAEVPVGAGVVLAGPEVVVTQPTDGEFRGFSAICTHQGCVVAEVTEDAIACRCHGSRFSIEDGSVLRGPAEQPLPEVAVAVEGDAVVRA